MICTGKEWDTCQEEKMGCVGCYYYTAHNSKIGKEKDNEQKVSERAENKRHSTD